MGRAFHREDIGLRKEMLPNSKDAAPHSCQVIPYDNAPHALSPRCHYAYLHSLASCTCVLDVCVLIKQFTIGAYPSAGCRKHLVENIRCACPHPEKIIMLSIKSAPKLNAFCTSRSKHVHEVRQNLLRSIIT